MALTEHSGDVVAKSKGPVSVWILCDLCSNRYHPLLLLRDLTSVTMPPVGFFLPLASPSFSPPLAVSFPNLVLLLVFLGAFLSWSTHLLVRCRLFPWPQNPDENDSQIYIWSQISLHITLAVEAYPVSWTSPLGYPWAVERHFDSVILRQFDLKNRNETDKGQNDTQWSWL